MSSGLFKNVIYKLFNYKSCAHVHVYKQDLALNNLQGLICYKTQPNQTKLFLLNNCTLKEIQFIYIYIYILSQQNQDTILSVKLRIC